MKTITSTNNLVINIVLNEYNVINEFTNDTSLVIFNERYDECIHQLAKAKGVKFYGQKRFNKLHQYLLMDRLNINTPKVYYNKHTNDLIRTLDELNAFVDLDEFVVKPNYGARGIGVKKITRKDYIKCLYNLDEVYNVFSDEFVDNNGNKLNKTINASNLSDVKHKEADIDTYYLKDSFREFLIQEPIDIFREFRVIYFKNKSYLIYERKRTDEFCANLSCGSTPTKVTDDEIKLIIDKNIKSFDQILDETNYPWVSIDLYIDKNDNFGIFEFQMEFAYEGFDYKLVKSHMIDNLNYLIDGK